MVGIRFKRSGRPASSAWCKVVKTCIMMSCTSLYHSSTIREHDGLGSSAKKEGSRN